MISLNLFTILFVLTTGHCQFLQSLLQNFQINLLRDLTPVPRDPLFIYQTTLKFPIKSETDFHCVDDALKYIITQLIDEVDGCKGIILDLEREAGEEIFYTEEIREVTNFIDKTLIHSCFSTCFRYANFLKISCMNRCFNKHYPVVTKLLENTTLSTGFGSWVYQARNETLYCVQTIMFNREEREQHLVDAKECCKYSFE